MIAFIEIDALRTYVFDKMDELDELVDFLSHSNNEVGTRVSE